jgi:flagellar basal body-associated protein FliL
MKVCQVCKSKYNEDLTFCLNDGSLLVNADFEANEETLNLPNSNTTEQRPIWTHEQNKATNADNLPKKKSWKLLFAAVISFLFLIPILAIVGGISYFGSKLSQNSNLATPIPASTTPKVFATTTPPKPTIQVEIQDKVNGSFGTKFLRCMVTNVGQSVIDDPKITLNLYKNDVKVGLVYGDSELEFLKPNQTIPMWVNISGKEYTSAKVEENDLKAAKKDEAELYPKLIYTDTKMTSKTLTSSYNFKSYPEIFYTVKGIVTNNDYEKINPNLYVFYYDDKKQIVGIRSTRPPELKKGEKAEFEVGVGETQIFGKPVDYEVFAIAN